MTKLLKKFLKMLEAKMPYEKTLVIIKPDGVSEGYVPEILRKFEAEKLAKKFYKKCILESQKVEQLYSHLKEKITEQNFLSILQYMTSGDSVLIVYERENAIANVRKICGPTDPFEARQYSPNSIRAFSKDSLQRAINEMRAVHNIVHSSGTLADAEREIKLFGIDL